MLVPSLLRVRVHCKGPTELQGGAQADKQAKTFVFLATAPWGLRGGRVQVGGRGGGGGDGRGGGEEGVGDTPATPCRDCCPAQDSRTFRLTRTST